LKAAARLTHVAFITTYDGDEEARLMAERRHSEPKSRGAIPATRDQAVREAAERAFKGVREATDRAIKEATRPKDHPISAAIEAIEAIVDEPAPGVTKARRAEIRQIVKEISNLLGGHKVIGASIESELDAHEMLRQGLPWESLTSLVEKLHDLPVIKVSEALGVSPRTLQRHKAAPGARLDAQQSGRAWTFAEILAKATRVFGSQDEAEQWLQRPAIGLNRQRPIDFLTTPAGVQLVETYLGRLEYGVYT
jgi:putative toxin-antitoxin system antitoxin component (TIGR02293 family)